MIARRLMAFATAGLAVIALATSGALADPTVETFEESTGVHCAQVFLDGDHGVSGGCLVHATTIAPIRLWAHMGGGFPIENEYLRCDSELSARIDESGDGWFYDQAFAPNPSACGAAACDEAAPEHSQVPWPLEMREESGTMLLRTTLCLRGESEPEGAASSGLLVCQADLTVIDLGGHQLDLAADQAPCINTGGTTELSGQWRTEDVGGTTDLEVSHL